MKVFRRLWRDEAGFIISTELVLIATILVIGMIVGLTSLRNQVVLELTDLGQAIGSVNSSYGFDGLQATDQMGNTIAYVDGSVYTDPDAPANWTLASGAAGMGGVSVADILPFPNPTGNFGGAPTLQTP